MTLNLITPICETVLREPCITKKVADFQTIHNFALHRDDFQFACIINAYVQVKKGGYPAVAFRLDEYVEYIDGCCRGEFPDLPRPVAPLNVEGGG